jgi:hypothetical protein
VYYVYARLNNLLELGVERWISSKYLTGLHLRGNFALDVSLSLHCMVKDDAKLIRADGRSGARGGHMVMISVPERARAAVARLLGLPLGLPGQALQNPC